VEVVFKIIVKSHWPPVMWNKITLWKLRKTNRVLNKMKVSQSTDKIIKLTAIIYVPLSLAKFALLF